MVVFNFLSATLNRHHANDDVMLLCQLKPQTRSCLYRVSGVEELHSGAKCEIEQSSKGRLIRCEIYTLRHASIV